MSDEPYFLLYACHLLVHSPLAVPHQLPEDLFESAPITGLIPQRVRACARVRRFSIFSFTASPIRGKVLRYRGLKVKASPRFPSPVKC